jgi:hypothetical protein
MPRDDSPNTWETLLTLELVRKRFRDLEGRTDRAAQSERTLLALLVLLLALGLFLTALAAFAAAAWRALVWYDPLLALEIRLRLLEWGI